ncbi:hypothetical protein LPJ70_005316 [Coemansia sp. RSA 2708]|nr:hypothetical protein LPJ70_005316 [Coemansia sp. RSA 2708]
MAVLIVSTLAIFVDTVVYGIIVPFLPNMLQDRLGMSPSTNGLLFGCFGIGIFVGSPLSAYVSDRWNIRKWPMIFGLLSLGAATVLFALSNAYWELIVARLAQGISSGITWSVGLGMIADVYQGESLGWAMGIAFSGYTLGYLGGPVFGGAIYSAGGVHAIAIFVGSITAVDLIFRLLLVEPKHSKSASALHTGSETNLVLDRNEDQFAADIDNACVAGKSVEEPELAHHIGAIQPAAVSTSIIADSATIDAVAAASDHQVTECATKRTTLWDLLKEWPILACCIATITTSGVEGALEPALPIYMRDKFGSGPVVISLVFISYFVPDIVVSPIAGKYTSSQSVLDKLAPFGRFTFIIVASVLLAVAVACLGATTSIAGLVVNLVFGGMLGGVAVVPILSIMGEHVERMGGNAYAKVYALFNIAFSVGVIIVPTIVPPIMSAIGFAATMGVISAILVLGAIILAVHPTRMLMKHGRAAYLGKNALPFL